MFSIIINEGKPFRQIVSRYTYSDGLFFASGGQGAFLKNRPLDPRKTFYKPSALPTIDE
jgi:hypothetical protein